MPSDLVNAALAFLAANPYATLMQALSACQGDGSTLVAAMTAILTAAGITPATLGPDMIDQLVAWEKVTERDEVIAVMLRSAE